MPRSPFSSLPSSPASSPSYGPADSSPPSSPGLSHSQLSADFDSPPRSPALVHPFAGSSKATKKVRLYEKQESRWGAEMNDDAPAEDEDGTSTKFGDCDASMTACANSDSEFDAFFGETDTEDAALEEQELWDKTISEAIDDGNGLIDLSTTGFGGGITSIPPSVADLENLVVLPSLGQPSRLSPAPASTALSTAKPLSARVLTRAKTAPVVFGARRPGGDLFPSSSNVGWGKAASGSLAVGSSAKIPNEVQLYVANHSIRFLPTELFWISNLAVLSLRGNKLVTLPPLIATSLPHLRELNVSLNELKFLPAEILGLRLEALSLAGNPWLSRPSVLLPATSHPDSLEPATANEAKPRYAQSPHIGTLAPHFHIPPLTELCLRILMAPSTSSLHTTCLASREYIPVRSRELTMLETKYELPLVRTDFPASVIDAVYGCIPRSITNQRRDSGSHKVQASPSKKARVDRAALREDTFPQRSLSTFSSPFSSSRPSSSRFAMRTHSHASLFSSRSRSSISRSGVALDPPKPAMPGISVCPSPLHLGQMGKPVYIRHAVERLTWEDEIAGVKMGEADGVPVLWRGCGPHCLDWLDEGDEDGDAEVAGDHPATAEAAEGSDFEFQPTNLSGSLADAFYESDG